MAVDRRPYSEQKILNEVYDENNQLLKVSASLVVGDIEIGAVEIKDATTASRVNVADDVSKVAMYVQSESLASEVTASSISLKVGSIKDTDGIKKITDALPTGANTIGDVTVSTVTESQTNALQEIAWAHHKAHIGDFYTCSDARDFSGNASQTILLITPNTASWAHVVVAINHELEGMYTLTEAISSSTTGTAVTSYNRERNSTNTAGMSVYINPATPSGGTVLVTHWQGSGKKEGGDRREGGEWILKQNTNYLIKMLNKTANNNVFDWELNWYETKFN